MGQHNKIWRIAKPNRPLQEIFSQKLGISGITAQLLINRGISTLEEARSFIRAEMDNLQDPFLFKDMETAVQRILQAIDRKEKILIYGDYDVDGITSTTVLYKFLQDLGADLDYYIPDRSDEGYGLNKTALQWAKDAHFSLVITVDCGISAVEEVEFAAGIGLDIIITDHHEAPEILPNAVAVIDPKQNECNYPFEELAGVGVAWKLGQALFIARGISLQTEQSNLDLVALGTIADIVPLQGENRIIVKHGLKYIQNTTNVGLRALIEVCGIGDKEISSHQIGFMVAPRLNATGRIGSAREGVKLLLTKDQAEAAAIAQALDKENEKRQSIEAGILEEAETILAREFDSTRDRVIVLAAEGWHPGVIGIVASRLVEKYYRPTIMICLEGEEGKGSARSIPGFNLYDALTHCKDYLLKYGGHKQAAGLSLERNRLADFREEINKYALENLAEEYLIPQVNLDAEIGLNEVNHQFIKELELLSPFGHQNPGPLLACRKASVLGCREVGNGGNHLKMRVSARESVVDTIGFRLGQWAGKLNTNDRVDLAFVPEFNVWQGRTAIQLNVKDIKFAHWADNPFAVEEEKTFIDRLFEEAANFLVDDYYRNIGLKDEFYSKVVGVTFDNRQETISRLKEGDVLLLVREPQNAYDTNAVRVETVNHEQVGYLNAGMAKYLAPLLDSGQRYNTIVTNVTGGGDKNYGLNVIMQKALDVDLEKEKARLAETRQKLAGYDDESLLQAIKEVLLGGYDYRAKQWEAIASLLAGHNTLAIFGTGRGKSAVFQTVAAFKALRENKMTIIIYPLRALVNDQYEAMQQKFKPLGISIFKANGSISSLERAQLFNALDEGKADILLTTPEFIEFHQERFNRDLAKIAFFVVDESHHISLASNSHRPAYKRLDRIQESLGKPLTLAVTATAGDEVAREITGTLNINKVIVDPHVRNNLILVDKRDWANKNEYIKEVVATGGKTIIYVNSRIKTIELATYLREALPFLSDQIIFYNAGMSSEQRNQVERMFRDGTIKTVVTTSAFGEGIDIPDIRNVILYHLNFNFTEYNQQSGRAGRDGQPAKIHLLFGRRDVAINQFILESMAPDKDLLGKLYLTIKKLAAQRNPIEHTNGEIAEMLNKMGIREANDKTVSVGLGIFDELGLIEREREGRTRKVHFAPPPEDKIELEDSLRYSEGMEEKKAFEEYWQFLFGSETDTLLQLVNRPICPKKYETDEVAL